MLLPHDYARVVYGTPKVLGLLLAQNTAAEFVELTLLKGGSVPAHSLEIPVSFYIVEGEGTVSVDGGKFAAGAGDMVFSKAGSVRELTNTGDGDLKVLVIKHTG